MVDKEALRKIIKQGSVALIRPHENTQPSKGKVKETFGVFFVCSLKHEWREINLKTGEIIVSDVTK